MAILAANCPCCGRDIGFDESAKEYTCIFCGAKLITATLVKERLDSHANSGYERYRKGDESDVMHRQGRSSFSEPRVTVTRAEEIKPETKRPEPEKKPEPKKYDDDDGEEYRPLFKQEKK